MIFPKKGQITRVLVAAGFFLLISWDSRYCGILMDTVYIYIYIYVNMKKKIYIYISLTIHGKCTMQVNKASLSLGSADLVFLCFVCFS